MTAVEELDHQLAGGLGVAVIATSSLGDRSYLATDGAVAVVVDPQREVPAGAVWVHCGSGYHATAAASLLEHAGRTPVLIDDLFGNAEHAGLALTPAA